MAGPFERAGIRMTEEVAAALDAFGEIIMAESLEQCPIETGTLRRSARIYRGDGGAPARGAGGRFIRESTVVIGYGFGEEINPKTRRPASEYAVPVHEIIEAYHEPPTKAKFLEDPVYEHASMMEPFLAAGMRDGGTERVLAFIEGNAALMSEGAGVPPAGLDAGDHPRGVPHD